MQVREALAIEGGTPVRREPMPRRIVMGEAERDAVLRIFDRELEQGGGFDRYGGTEVDAFEAEFARFVGTEFATATSSGTASIHSALAALRLEPQSEVISPPITDPGAVMPIVWQGCLPVFADVDPETFNLDPASVAERITERTRAIIVTHLIGQPADLDPILAIANRHGLPVIEDCAQAHGATYHGRIVGGLGRAGAFSLMSGKHTVAGGQGGMVVTNDPEIYWNAKRFADRGKPFNSAESRNLFLGLNYRMTELEATIGRVQLQKLPALVRRRQQLVEGLRERIADLQAVRIGKVIDGAESSFWFLLLRVDADKLTVDKDAFAEAVRAEGLTVAARYDHIAYDAPWLRDRQTLGASGWPWSATDRGRALDYADSCPNARRAIATHMTVSLHEGWTDRELDDLAAALRKVERAYRRV
ncbi:MAG TPA: DegT/DnrJ/EryC1/StrS family aminotransferase [Chloroflexota bacterium]|nr:DegT/DnrJ/EryC1/StrS family aminotransferase [Chloroflexota bacterium]